MLRCRYASSESDPTSDARNLISLRRDLHYLFDSRHFTFVPRIRGNTRRLELYVFCPNSDVRLVSRYHNLPPQPLSGISIECVLARFAWTIFSPSIMPFFLGMAKYAVRLFNIDSGEWEDENLRAPDSRMKLGPFDRSLQSRGNMRKRKCAEHNDTEYFGPYCGSDLGNSSYDDLSRQSQKRRNTLTSDFAPVAYVVSPNEDESEQSTETELYVNKNSASGKDSDAMMACNSPDEDSPHTANQAASEPLSNACDTMTQAALALSSTKSLTATIRNLQSHNNRTLALRRELSDLTIVLEVLVKTIATHSNTDFDLLKPLLHRCGTICDEFGELVSSAGMGTTGAERGITSWSRQEYLQRDINDFRDVLAAYKSTINITLANVNL